MTDTQILFNKLLKDQKYIEAADLCEKLIAQAEASGDEEQLLRGEVYKAILAYRTRDYTSALSLFEKNYEGILTRFSKKWLGMELINTYHIFAKPDPAIHYINRYLTSNPPMPKLLPHRFAAAALLKTRADNGSYAPATGLLLSPMLAGAAMSLSSVSVIANALRLGRVNLD